jgi:hypothetical protein
MCAGWGVPVDLCSPGSPDITRAYVPGAHLSHLCAERFVVRYVCEILYPNNSTKQPNSRPCVCVWGLHGRKPQIWIQIKMQGVWVVSSRNPNWNREYWMTWDCIWQVPVI